VAVLIEATGDVDDALALAQTDDVGLELRGELAPRPTLLLR